MRVEQPADWEFMTPAKNVITSAPVNGRLFDQRDSEQIRFCFVVREFLGYLDGRRGEPGARHCYADVIERVGGIEVLDSDFLLWLEESRGEG
jgi:hypothetical protein